MGNARSSLDGGAPAEGRVEYTPALARVTQSRLEFTSQIFRSLCINSKSSGNTLDRTTFLQYFPLPGILGERLFEVFDLNASGSIDFGEFASGVATIYHGTVEEKRKFLFHLYDLDGDGYVTKADVATVIAYVPSAYAKCLDDSESDLMSSTSAEAHQAISKKIADLVSVAFEKVEHESGASYPVFSAIATSYPLILEVINLFFDETLPDREFAAYSGMIVKKGPAEPAASAVPPPALQSSLGSEFSARCDSFSGNDSFSSKRSTRSDEEALLALPREETRSDGEEGEDKGEEKPADAPAPEEEPEPVLPPPFVHSCPMCETVCALRNCVGCGAPLKVENGEYYCACGMNFEMRHCYSCGVPLRSATAPPFTFTRPFVERVEEPKKTTENGRPEAAMVGTMAKVGQFSRIMTTRYFRLVDRFLYYHADEKERKPKGVIYLEGCMIFKMPTQRLANHYRHGLTIQASNSRRSRSFFCQTSKERDAWVQALGKVSQSHRFHELYDVKMIEQLGKGRFASVYPGIRKRDRAEVAVKIIPAKTLRDDEREYIRTEISILRLAEHPNIVRLYDVFHTADAVSIVMERVIGGDLLRMLIGLPNKHLSEKDGCHVMRNVVRGVNYLHNHGITHRDLKPENILVETDSSGICGVKITDFGLSAIAARSLDQALGTVAYAAPEVLESRKYDRAVDLWSVGAIAYVIISGELPFKGKKDREIVERIVACSYSFSRLAWRNKPAMITDFISKLLVLDATKRLTAAQALGHEWLREPTERTPISSRAQSLRTELEVAEAVGAAQFSRQRAVSFAEDGLHGMATRSRLPFEDATERPRRNSRHYEKFLRRPSQIPEPEMIGEEGEDDGLETEEETLELKPPKSPVGRRSRSLASPKAASPKEASPKKDNDSTADFLTPFPKAGSPKSADVSTLKEKPASEFLGDNSRLVEKRPTSSGSGQSSSGRARKFVTISSREEVMEFDSDSALPADLKALVAADTKTKRKTSLTNAVLPARLVDASEIQAQQRRARNGGARNGPPSWRPVVHKPLHSPKLSEGTMAHPIFTPNEVKPEVLERLSGTERRGKTQAILSKLRRLGGDDRSEGSSSG